MFTTPELPPSRPPLDRSGWFSGGLAMEGELLKQNKHIGWSRRYFVISKGVNSLFIYKDARKTEV
jgi:hypothetical protein